ncbi:MAG TPA: hypothetical protein VMH40_21440 [Myxococcaceae bacterium]|nr:hypothetical protein [Myxococcaceae bacterium]
MGTQIEFASPYPFTGRRHVSGLLVGLFLVLGYLTSVAVLVEQGSPGPSEFEQIA